MIVLLKTLLRWFGLAVVGATTILALVVVLVIIIAPRVDLSNMRPRIEAVVGQALGRPMELQGPLVVILSLPPSLEAAQIRIGNPPNWPRPEFASIDKISASVALTPLLRRQIVIKEIDASGVRLALETAADGQNNWTLPAGEQETGGTDWKLVAIDDLSLRDLVLQFKVPPQQTTVELRIEEFTAQLPADDLIRIKTVGVAQGFPFSFDVVAGSLDEWLTADRPVPVKVALELNNNRLEVDGTVTRPLERQEVDASFQLEGERVADLAAILDASLPVIGDYRLKGELSGVPNKLAISGIDGHLASTAFTGDLQLDNTGERLRIEGSLVATTLDLGPWLATEQTPAQSRPGVETDATAAVVPDVDLHLEVNRFLNLPVEVEDASLTLKLRGDSLTVPLQFKFDDVVVRGEIGVERKNGKYSATAALHTQQTDIGDLIERYSDLLSVAGKVGTLTVEASSQGNNTRSFIENLGVNVQVRDAAMTYGNRPGETPISVDLDEMTFHGTSRQRALLSINGRLLGEPFSADLKLGDLPTLLEDRNLPFDLRATGVGAELTMNGQLAGKESTDNSTLQVQLSGKRLGELAPWLGVSPDVKTPYSLSGELSVQNDGDAWRLHSLYARLGRSSIEGAIGRTHLKSEPLLQASLAFDVIDPIELDRIFFGEQPREKKTSSGDVDMDMPILPRGLNLKDMDIDIKGKRVALEPSDITDIAFSTRIRDGFVSGAPFRGALAETRFTGNLAVDLRGEVPQIKYDLEAIDVDVGGFLRDLKLATEIDAHAERLTATVVSRGSSMSELFNDTEINVEAHAGRWLLTDPNKAGSAHIEVVHGTAKATTRTRQTVVKLDARIGEVPLDFTLETKRLPKRTGVKEFLDTRITAIAAGAELTMQGVLPRLSGLSGLDMHVSFRGDRINTLDELLKVSLPPFGPYAIDGHLRIGDTGYSLSNIEVRVGGTIAKGDFTISTAGAKPQLSWMLEAETFQLDDFRIGDWSPVADTDGEVDVIDLLDREFRDLSPPTAIENKIVESKSVKKPAQQQDNGKRTQAESAQPLLSREVMHSFNGKADFRVGEVLSGQDRLGSGEMSIALQNGKLSLPLNIDVPGGDVVLELGLQANEQDYAATLRSKIENFDYGIFARRIKPNTDMAGKFSIDVDLASQGETLSLIDDNADGYFDFVIWPETLRSGIFDMWTANLFFAVLPMLNLQTQSKVNCLVGRFDMKDGVMKPKPLFMDTTRTQVRGKGEINFRSERIKLRLTPHSKRPKFFSLATPMVVEGSFSDFGVGLRPHDLFGTAIRMMYTLVLVPVEYVIRGVRPAVDTEECEKPIGVREER
jgi:uncharacterized protein involved in outer membrane biogenesis